MDYQSATILDCACGIGTQAIGLAALGYSVTASDLSVGALTEASIRAKQRQVELTFAHGDFCALQETFSRQFDIVICMDNALPHMPSSQMLGRAINSIVNQLVPGGIFVASIRDYDAILASKPPYSPPYIRKTGEGQRVSFQTWSWNGEHYRLIQYIIDDGGKLEISKFECEYRAVRRAELTAHLSAAGASEVTWLFPEETGFYQPIVVARK